MNYTPLLNIPGFTKTLLSLILMVFLNTGCTGGKNTDSGDVARPESESSFMLGTLIELSVYGRPEKSVFRDAFKTIADLENKLSRNIETSEISEINSKSGIAPVRVGAEAFYVIEKGLYYSSQSEGFFDISIGPVVSLWGIGSENARLPRQEEIDQAVSLVDFRKIKLDSDDGSVYLEKKGMEIDLGAIAKGYIADRTGEMLRSRGVESAIINLGGNVLLIGKKPDGSPFRIGIQNPFEPRGKYLGILEAQDISIVTSGIYERYFEKDGKMYHHILNPVTGYPVDNDIMGISVITGKSVDGDALSTSLFMLGLGKALEYVDSHEGMEAVIVSKDKKIYLSKGMGSSFRLTDNNFIMGQ